MKKNKCKECKKKVCECHCQECKAPKCEKCNIFVSCVCAELYINGCKCRK